MAFADGVTGVLVWGGGDELRLTVGRADLWDHRGGYPWTNAQSYSNIVRLWRTDEESDNSCFSLAEGGGFEPPVDLRPHNLSKVAPSTTRTPLQCVYPFGLVPGAGLEPAHARA
jgi:hypothetical protein